MASITALLHTENDALRLGRALETLYPCDEILVVDHGSRDGTVRVARDYGARVLSERSGASPGDYLALAKENSAATGSANARSTQWILCLDPRESLTEKLAASLFEWKSEAGRGNAAAASAFSFFLREETAEGWVEVPSAQTRLVPHSWKLWTGNFPAQEPSAIALEGELLRFIFP
jgi:glycosyltransferase involved in cell wall biosynthesis